MANNVEPNSQHQTSGWQTVVHNYHFELVRRVSVQLFTPHSSPYFYTLVHAIAVQGDAEIMEQVISGRANLHRQHIV
jgi:hypothetical protein